MQYTLNLVYPEKSDLKYKITNFSDSQVQFTLVDCEYSYSGHDVNIVSRLSWNDVQILHCVKAALNELGFDYMRLHIPYFLGARSDRKFEEGSSNYIKSVIAPLINNMEFDYVEVLDPHSDVVEACIDCFEKTDNVKLVDFAIQDLYKDPLIATTTTVPFVLVSPDAGALKKIYHVAEAIEYTGDIIVASKHRDIKTGKILSTEVPLYPQHALKDFIIVDDICDGGKTFVEIAKKIKETFRNAKIYLIVTHGIFSQGLSELSKWFNKIYTTNSINDLHESFIPGCDWLIKQLNVF